MLAYDRFFTIVYSNKLANMKAIHARLDQAVEFSYHLCADASDNDEVIAELPSGSI